MKNKLITIMFIGIVISLIFHILSVNNTTSLQCAEDEVAVHGGLENYYDPDAALECAHLDDMFERYWFDSQRRVNNG